MSKKNQGQKYRQRFLKKLILWNYPITRLHLSNVTSEYDKIKQYTQARDYLVVP